MKLSEVILFGSAIFMMNVSNAGSISQVKTTVYDQYKCFSYNYSVTKHKLVPPKKGISQILTLDKVVQGAGLNRTMYSVSWARSKATPSTNMTDDHTWWLIRHNKNGNDGIATFWGTGIHKNFAYAGSSKVVFSGRKAQTVFSNFTLPNKKKVTSGTGMLMCTATEKAKLLYR